jgi:hypothetical protein
MPNIYKFSQLRLLVAETRTGSEVDDWVYPIEGMGNSETRPRLSCLEFHWSVAERIKDKINLFNEIFTNSFNSSMTLSLWIATHHWQVFKIHLTRFKSLRDADEFEIYKIWWDSMFRESASSQSWFDGNDMWNYRNPQFSFELVDFFW